MEKVLDFIEDELKSYEEDEQDYMIYICENGIEIAHAWIEDFKEEIPQYMDRKIQKIEYYSEAAYVHI